MSAEAARLLNEQLCLDFPASWKRDVEKSALASAEARLRMYEDWLLALTNSNDPERARQGLVAMQALVKKMREGRVRAAKELEVELELRKDRFQRQIAVSNEPEDHLFSRLGAVGSGLAGVTQLAEAERRRENLVTALARLPNGTKKRLAEALGWSAPRISQVTSAPGARGHRSISSATARAIEKALGLEDGALDRVEQRASIAALQVSIDKLRKLK